MLYELTIPNTNSQRPKLSPEPKPNYQSPEPKTKDQSPTTKAQLPKTKDQTPNPHLPQSKINSHPFLFRLFTPYKNHCNCRSYNTHNQSSKCPLFRIVLVIEISLRLRCCFEIA